MGENARSAPASSPHDTDALMVKETRVAPVSSPQVIPSVGERIGPYVVERMIGKGGMGVVVAARHERLGELVAVKLHKPRASKDGVQAKRFEREARSTVKIKSEHVVRVLDAGSLEDGTPYIVMEHLVGRDLAKVLETDGPLGVAPAVDLMLQVCEAVAAAHAVGIVHRDLKPSNFFITQRPDGSALVKVLDFGISKAFEGEGDAKLTETQAVFGSPTYMSPEQIRSAKHVDHRSDIWSLGASLFELLTGKLPFMADNVAGMLASIVADPPYSLRGFAPLAPSGLEEVVNACLEKDVTKRVQSIAELAARLAPFASDAALGQMSAERAERIERGSVLPSLGSGPRLPAPPPPAASPSQPAPPVAFGTTGMDLAEVSAQARGHRVSVAFAIAGVVVAVLAVVTGGVVMAYRYGQRDASATMPEASPALAAGPATQAPAATATAEPAPEPTEEADPTPAGSSTAAASASKTTKAGARPTKKRRPTPGEPRGPAKPSDPTGDRL